MGKFNKKCTFSRILKAGFFLYGFFKGSSAAQPEVNKPFNGLMIHATQGAHVQFPCGNAFDIHGSDEPIQIPHSGRPGDRNTCMMNNGKVIDLCSGRILAEIKPSRFKMVDAPQSDLTSNLMYEFHIKKDLVIDRKEYCDTDIKFNVDVKFYSNDKSKFSKITLLDDGRIINYQTGEVLKQLRKHEFSTVERVNATASEPGRFKREL